MNEQVNYPSDLHQNWTECCLMTHLCMEGSYLSAYLLQRLIQSL